MAGGRARARPRSPGHRPAALRLGLATDGSAAHVHRVLDELAAAGIAVDRISSTRPTLDDVFLALTARPATELLETR